MTKVYHDNDVDLSVIQNETIAILGYGNQGRAEGMNLRDSGLHVIVGNQKDASWDRAVEDGFETVEIEEAVDRANLLFLLVPDEVQPRVYKENIQDRLRPGMALNFAHGYNIHYGFIEPPEQVDVIMVAPRMIGVGVRELFVKGSGAPAYIAVQQDASGRAKDRGLAIAKGIGATRVGAIETTFAEETEIDLFMEQATWAALSRVFALSYEFLVAEGYAPEIVALELYGSEEAAEIFHEMARVGFFKQMELHSQTSQYGTMSRGPRLIPEQIKETMKEVLEEIQTGRFAREWATEQMMGYPVFRKLKERAFAHPLNEVEERIRERRHPEHT